MSIPRILSPKRGSVRMSTKFFGARVAEGTHRRDVTLTAVAVRRDRAEYDTFYEGLGPGWRWRGWGGISTTTVETVPVGTLVMDVYQTGSHHLVWRGMAHDTLSDNPEKNAKKLAKAIDKMLSKFPNQMA